MGQDELSADRCQQAVPMVDADLAVFDVVRLERHIQCRKRGRFGRSSPADDGE
jgi:hypothetical protein